MFKDFSISTYGGHLVYRSGTILAILAGSHLGNIPMKFESHWPKGVCIPILVTTFPEWLSGMEPLPHTPGAVRPSSLCL